MMAARPQILVHLPGRGEQRGKRQSPDAPRREEARQARRVGPHRRRGLGTDFGNDLDDGLDGVGAGLRQVRHGVRAPRQRQHREAVWCPMSQRLELSSTAASTPAAPGTMSCLLSALQKNKGPYRW